MWPFKKQEEEESVPEVVDLEQLPPGNIVRVNSLEELDELLGRKREGVEGLPCPPSLQMSRRCKCISCGRRDTCGAEALCRKAGCSHMFISRCMVKESEEGEYQPIFTQEADNYIETKNLIDKHILPYTTVAVPVEI